MITCFVKSTLCSIWSIHLRTYLLSLKMIKMPKSSLMWSRWSRINIWHTLKAMEIEYRSQTQKHRVTWNTCPQTLHHLIVKRLKHQASLAQTWRWLPSSMKNTFREAKASRKHKMQLRIAIRIRILISMSMMSISQKVIKILHMTLPEPTVAYSSVSLMILCLKC